MFINFAFAQAGASGGGQGLLVQLLPLILIFVVFYFLLIRPQQKRVKQHKEMVNALKIGSTVVTSGGIVAKIVKLNDDLFKVKIKFLIWLISILFLSSSTSIEIKLGFDLFVTNLKDLLSELILKFSESYERSSSEDKIWLIIWYAKVDFPIPFSPDSSILLGSLLFLWRLIKFKNIKENSKVKFDATVDLAVRLGVDPRQANQMVRGVASLPHGTGKTLKVLALVSADKESEAKEAGADYVGLDEYIEKIKGGWTDIDVIVTMPSIMGKIGALGRVLGPRGLMPNPKSGTVTMDVAKAVADVKKGKIDFKVEKNGIIHASVAKVSFDAQKISENANELLQTIIKLKPSAAKGTYVKSVYMSSTMGLGIEIDANSLDQ